MFKFFFNKESKKYNLILDETITPINFKLLDSIDEEKKKIYRFVKTGLFPINKIYNNGRQITNRFVWSSFPVMWLKKLHLTVLLFWKIYKNIRFKIIFLNHIIYLLFFENTIDLKAGFRFIIKFLPLNKHKFMINKLLSTSLQIFSILQTHRVELFFKFIFKGKLGLRGDNKKKKNIHTFNTVYKYKHNIFKYNDGVGKSSKFGKTFFRIIYMPTYIITNNDSNL